MKAIPKEYGKEKTKYKDLTLGSLPEDKALGVKWNIYSIDFKIKQEYNPLTCSGMLSTLSSIYNPVGLGAAFLLKGQLIFLQLCNNKLD